MQALYILVPLSLVLLGVAVWLFFWATDDGQFDDLETPAWKIVLDDDSKPPDTDD
ncbi:MAG: cbb3-type cytochrome oxidase assembly protein CcoS [Xanthomonadaceae bacterium]|nr:cbb3-type cytochrome oxidase assembly protein CcoS [Xanthomonadaceae bacterium]